MTPTLKIILLLAGTLWGLACVAFVVALAAAAGRPTPEFKTSRHEKAQLRDEVKEHEAEAHARMA